MIGPMVGKDQRRCLVLWTLMSLRDVCEGRVSAFPGPFPNPFSRLLSDESGKAALFAAPKSFFDNS